MIACKTAIPTDDLLMIIPCIDLLEGKVVQLIQGREKAIEGEAPEVMLERFSAFPVIQVIDLDQALGKGSNLSLVREIASRARTRIGGGVRSVERAIELLECGAEKVIVGTSAYAEDGPDYAFLEELRSRAGAEKVLIALDTRAGHIVIKGWQETTRWTAEELIAKFEPYCGGFLCTYVDKEGMLQGTDMEWYRRLRSTTDHEITAAGGISSLDEIRELQQLQVHAALGMAVYTGHLSLEALALMQHEKPDYKPGSFVT